MCNKALTSSKYNVFNFENRTMIGAARGTAERDGLAISECGCLKRPGLQHNPLHQTPSCLASEELLTQHLIQSPASDNHNRVTVPPSFLVEPCGPLRLRIVKGLLNLLLSVSFFFSFFLSSFFFFFLNVAGAKLKCGTWCSH